MGGQRASEQEEAFVRQPGHLGKLFDSRNKLA